MTNIDPKQISIATTYPVSMYDIPLESLDSEENILAKNKGKVTMIVNVTGECANSAQYTTIQELYDKYKNLGFEVIAVPSTDFCDDAYGAFKESNASPTPKLYITLLLARDQSFTKVQNQ